MPSTESYIVEIEYLAKEKIEVQALSKAWAEIISREKWGSKRTEDIKSISVNLKK